MKTVDRILEALARRGSATGTALAKELQITRQAVSRHLKALVRDGRVVKSGETRGAAYTLPGPGKSLPSGVRAAKTLTLEGLQEDRVFNRLSRELNLEGRLSSPALVTCRYAFTEMLNNAIDHSKAAEGWVVLECDTHEVRFEVRDRGIGVFDSIASRFGLEDEMEAIGELLKGKATTMADRHSGEGIFFTSRAGDKFSLRSHGVEIVFEGHGKDVRLERRRYQEGTQVQFALSRRSRTRLEDIFLAFAPEEFDYRFERSLVNVTVALEDCVSRSQAKRLVSRLESFKEVILDFKGVQSVGQAFCDEVFRVFLSRHPECRLRIRDLDQTLRVMVLHAVDKTTKHRLTFD